MEKLNFGCGNRFNPDWTNIDFHSYDIHVIQVNLLNGFPFSADHFEIVYSSHVLEHFTHEQSFILLKEAYRVLKNDGILRIVLPDLENSCREYLRILNLKDSDPFKQKLYNWIIIELLDQLVRTKSGGKMGPMIEKIVREQDKEMIDYIKARTESHLQLNNTSNNVRVKNSLSKKLAKRFSRHRILTKLNYWYIRFIRYLLPKNIRNLVFIDTAIGERHQWMYDSYSIGMLLKEAGFKDVKIVSYNESSIPEFNKYLLDINPDGSSYKNNSIFIEAIK